MGYYPANSADQFINPDVSVADRNQVLYVGNLSLYGGKRKNTRKRRNRIKRNTRKVRKNIIKTRKTKSIKNHNVSKRNRKH